MHRPEQGTCPCLYLSRGRPLIHWFAGRGGRVVLLTESKGFRQTGDVFWEAMALPDMPSSLTSLLDAFPIQLRAYHVAIDGGADVEQLKKVCEVHNSRVALAMKRLPVFALTAFLIAAWMQPVAAQSNCMMQSSFEDPYPVMHDGRKSMFWVRPLEVDADGARNAYHRDDPHGSKGKAIEYLGNGMTILRHGRELKFIPEQLENSEWLHAYRVILKNGWKPPPGFDVDIYGIAKDENDNICMTKGGRLISSTSLVQNDRAARCDPSRYVDALKLPGIVVPNREKTENPVQGGDPEIAPPFSRRGIARGDLAVVYNPETKIWKGAFIYDTGPRNLLGEGSVRLVLDLRALRELPVSGDQTNSLGIPETHVVVFAGTARRLGPGWTWTSAKIHALAEESFKQWGGGSIAGALHKLAACAADYMARYPESLSARDAD
jgi:hypothetical protein